MTDNLKNFGEIIIQYNPHNDYKIKIKNPIYTLKNYASVIYYLFILNDRRLVSGFDDNSIIRHNKVAYQLDIIIKEHKNNIKCFTQLSSGILSSCSNDKTIKLFNIKGMKYEILQTLNSYTDYVYKIIGLKNKNLVSCSRYSTLVFYLKYNNPIPNPNPINLKYLF